MSTPNAKIINKAKPPFHYMGGKRRLARLIIPLMPDHKCYVEPFCGAAAIFISKPRAKIDVINDINGEIINIFRVIQHHEQEFLSCMKWLLYSREDYTRFKNQDPTSLTDIQRAVRYFYLITCGFGGKTKRFNFGVTTDGRIAFNLENIKQNIELIHARLKGVIVENLDWRECVQKYDRAHTLFYFDPPYYKLAAYKDEFGADEYQKIKAIMESMKGKAILSINKHPETVKLFGGFNCSDVSLKYTLSKDNNKTPATEMIVTNF